MADFETLEDKVKNKKSHGNVEYDNIHGEAVYLSCGIREAFMEGDRIDEVLAAVRKFQKGDYGTAEENGKTEKEGHEYGRYDISGLTSETGEDTAVWIHRTQDSLIVYFKFER